MGSDNGDTDESPAHQVAVSSFLVGTYEVTQEQYQIVMSKNPSYFPYDLDALKRPVENVSWYDAIAFCNKLSEKEGLQRVYSIKGIDVQTDFSKNGYRLPTEAEWEYAASGGVLSNGFAYSGSENVGEVGWYESNSGSTTHQVGTKSPNELGIYDMSGNVWEWCGDWYGFYHSGAQTDPTGPVTGGYRAYRGGCWGYNAGTLRSSNRDYLYPGHRDSYVGFRVVRRP
jgi:formylglycine-generating enzyme required for sulfatase activity